MHWPREDPPRHPCPLPPLRWGSHSSAPDAACGTDAACWLGAAPPRVRSPPVGVPKRRGLPSPCSSARVAPKRGWGRVQVQRAGTTPMNRRATLSLPHFPCHLFLPPFLCHPFYATLPCQASIATAGRCPAWPTVQPNQPCPRTDSGLAHNRSSATPIGYPHRLPSSATLIGQKKNLAFFNIF
jgi:hypothetical protein